MSRLPPSISCDFDDTGDKMDLNHSPERNTRKGERCGRKGRDDNTLPKKLHRAAKSRSRSRKILRTTLGFAAIF